MSTDAGGAGGSSTRASAPPALELKGVTKRFGDLVANHDVSFAVAKGEIRALLGENGAGKSTLMNLVFGLLHPDAGEIFVDGKLAQVSNPRDARALGIGMVHQHFKLVQDMTVAENVALSRGEMGIEGLDLAGLRRRIEALAGEFGLAVDPDARIENLSVGQQQRVEILKLLVHGADILILDEPTAVLTPPEWTDLAEVLRQLAAQGRTIVFISHKLQEIIEIADLCTILRDGQVVDTCPVEGASREHLAKLMVGREVSLRFERSRSKAGQEVLRVDDLTVNRDGRAAVKGVSFEVRGGEVFGIAGVDGNGQAELIDGITGAAEVAGGEIFLDGRPLDLKHAGSDPRVGVIPEDRHRDGVALDLTILDNLMLREFDRPPFARRGFRRAGRVRAHGAEIVREFDVRTPSLEASLSQLSGGNQQKVVLARELSRSPKLLIAAQPTRGLDVGAMESVYKQMAEFKAAGGATLLISTELEEIMSIADRIAVMVGGHFTGLLVNEEATLDVLGPLMAGETHASVGHGGEA